MAWIPRPAAARRYYLLIPAVVFAGLWITLWLGTGPGVWTLRPVETIRIAGVVYTATAAGELEPAGPEPINLTGELTPNPSIGPAGGEPGYWLTNRPLAGEAAIRQAGVRVSAHLGASQLLVVANLGYWLLLPFLGIFFLVGTYLLDDPEQVERPLALARLGFALLAVLALLPGLPGLLWALSRFTRGLPAP